MEKALSLLRKTGILTQWSDQQILPGQQISQKIRDEMEHADIFVFLLSQDFIASVECMKEWEYARESLSQRKLIFRIPIVLEDCAWKDLLNFDDLKALPNDGTPVIDFPSVSTAWQQVYEGLKDVTSQLRTNFSARNKFIDEIQETEFSSQQSVKLEDIFIFLTLKCYPPQTDRVALVEETIKDERQLLEKNYSLIHGEEMSGKTALARHLFLHLSRESEAVLLIDLNEVSGKPREKIFAEAYQNEFYGDYSLWKQNPNKTLILDNLSPATNSLDLLSFAKEFFARVIVLSSSDSFYSFFKDEPRLSDFHEMNISPLTHVQQERLIRTRLTLIEENGLVADGLVDQTESRVNSIIISNRIVPRYPFFVLSILQTCEAFMPDNLSISSYGHCYHALIVANLIKAGISRSDNDINACFNFAEKLAFDLYINSKNGHSSKEFDFEGFVVDYNKIYIIPQAVVSRLKHIQYGILTPEGRFRVSYMYYFFSWSIFLERSR